MTALNPNKELHPRGVASKRYAPNTTCAVPGCTELAESNHHVFGRKPPEPDSWFVRFSGESDPIPHVTGLCGSGTTGHHGDVEEHRAWIEYDQEGVFVWHEFEHGEFRTAGEYVRVGPLDPQPGAPAKKRGAPKRDKSAGPIITYSVKAPKDDPDAAQRLKDKTLELLDKFNEAGHKIGPTVALERAVDYTLLNAGDEDF